jgi:predicted nucleotidyltransferase component of viral defense system
MNLQEEIEKLINEGYSAANASARVCQDIILYGIANGSMNRNVTIKGGVVMRNISKNSRRATQDIDLDFIRYSISNESIKSFINKLYIMDGIKISLIPPIVELKHTDYKGKRVFLEITDEFGSLVDSKIDIGVHKDLDMTQEEYCFDICFQEDGASLLMNSREQIVTEKLKSFLRYGSRSTRYKDVFDICYLSDGINTEKLLKYIQRYIFDDSSLPVHNVREISNRIERVFTDQSFIRGIRTSRKNWMDISIEEALENDIAFIKSLQLLDT